MTRQTTTPSSRQTAEQNAKRAKALRGYAATMAAEIEKKRNCNAGLNLTRKRLEEQRHAAKDADRLEKQRALLLRIADLYEQDSVPTFLTLRYRKEAEFVEMITRVHDDRPERGFQFAWSDMQRHKPYSDTFRAIGITNESTFILTREWALRLFAGQEDSDHKKQMAIRNKEKELAIAKIPDFFPTPAPLIDELLQLANIGPGMTVLRPYA